MKQKKTKPEIKITYISDTQKKIRIGDICFVESIFNRTAEGEGFQADPFGKAVGAVHKKARFGKNFNRAGIFKRFFGGLCISTKKSSRTEKHTSEIPGYHTGHILQIRMLQNRQHRSSRSLCRFLVIVATGIFPTFSDDKCRAVMLGIPVAFLHLIKKRHRLFFRIHCLQMGDKFRLLFFDFSDTRGY